MTFPLPFLMLLLVLSVKQNLTLEPDYLEKLLFSFKRKEASKTLEALAWKLSIPLGNMLAVGA